MEAWNAAYVRIEDCLRAHRIHNRLHQSRLIQIILERAARRHAQQPALEPTLLAAEEMRAMMDEWFGVVLGDPTLPEDRVATAGRVALLLCDGSQRWPYAFLDTQAPAPSELTEAMRERAMQAGPDLQVSSMVPRPIDLGTITEAAGETLERIERWPLLRALVLWGLFVGALGVIFFLTR